MPCASPDLKQAGACGRRPGQVSRQGGKQPTKKHIGKVTKTNRIWYSWGKGCPPFSLPPSLVSIAQFSCFPQLYQIQLVIPFVTPNCSKTTDIYCPYVWFWLHNAAFSSLLLSPPLPRFLSSPNPIRYSWRTRGDSSLWPPGTVTELPSGTSPGPPQNPKSGIQNPKSGIQNPKFPNPKSKIQTFSAGFWGFWILDRYVAILYVRPPTPQILDFGFWISDFGFWTLDFGFWISDFGFWILDFGFWILERYVAFLFVQILDFGFRILDFGFRILDFGFRILDFGFRILDFGFRILDCGFWTKFWMLHNIQYCARRPGSADLPTFTTLIN